MKNILLYIFITIFFIVIFFPQTKKLFENFGSVESGGTCSKDTDCLSSICAGTNIRCTGGTGAGKCAQIPGKTDSTVTCSASNADPNCYSKRCAGVTGVTCTGTGVCASLPEGTACSKSKTCYSGNCSNRKCT